MTEQRTILAVIIFLGTLSLLVVGGGVFLTATDHAIPDALIAIGGGAVGALSSILARTSSGPDAVQVVNRPDDPVPVDPA